MKNEIIFATVCKTDSRNLKKVLILEASVISLTIAMVHKKCSGETFRFNVQVTVNVEMERGEKQRGDEEGQELSAPPE